MQNTFLNSFTPICSFYSFTIFLMYLVDLPQAMKKTFLLLFLLLLVLDVKSQENTPVADSLITVLNNQTKQDSNRLKTLIQLTAEVRYYDLDKAMQYAQQAYDLGESLNREVEKGKALYYLAITNYFKGFPNLALEYLEEFSDIFEARNDSLRLSFGYNMMGVIYTEQREDVKAIEYLIRSTEIANSLQDYEGVLTGYSNIGSLYLNLGEEEKAREYYQKSVDITLENHLEEQMGAPFVNLAGAVEDQQQKEELYQVAERAFKKQNNMEGLGQIINSRGDDAHKAGNYQEAIRQYQEAVQLFKENQLQLEVVNTLYKLGGTFMDLRQYANAEKVLKQSLNISEEIGSNEVIVKTLNYLTDLHEKMNQPGLALAEFKRMSALKDSLENDRRATLLAKNEARFQSAQKEKNLQEKEQELLRQRANNNRIIIWALVALLTLGGVLGTYYYRQKKKGIQHENELKIKELESENLREKERIKSAFFANISHEFRTPLTLIISPLKEIIQNNQSGGLTKVHKTILRNGERLLELVNQLLDLSKLESETLKLEPEQTDINAFLKGLAGTFESMAAGRDITFLLNMPAQPINAQFDKDKVHKIVNNLLSNAFKFTPEGGTVKMVVSTLNRELRIQVSDTGIGISEEDLPHIFERFYQSDTYKKPDLMGTGIGLALTRELVEFQGGEIIVKSQKGQGSQFEILLPVLLESQPSENVEILIPATHKKGLKTVNASIGATDLPLLLVVEDNPDVAGLIQESLHENYQIIHAENGLKGLNLAQNQIPEAIISDVMMPEMDGFEFCEKIKTDTKTAHIPVILLTALSGQKDKMTGLETGADAYLSKPFEIHELKVRLRNLIELRQNLKASFSKLIKIRPEESELNSVDAVFVQTVKNTLEEEYSNEQFNVDALADALNLSRRQLSRKFKALFDQTPIDTIRQFRLEKAHELLYKKVATPTEVAYLTGFSSPAYFSKCFSDHFGYAPSKV